MSANEAPVDITQSRERPGCVTVYAVLLWIAGGLYLLGSLLAVLSSLSIDEPALLFLACFVILLAAIPIATGYGLWHMKTWAWWVIVILQSFGVIFGLLSMGLTLLVSASFGGMESFSGIGASFLGLIIGGVILYWFITNRQLFGIGVTTFAMVEGPDGEMIQQPVGTSGTGGQVAWIILGVVLVALVVPVCVIVLLALLGPAIGNVFSNIIMGI